MTTCCCCVGNHLPYGRTCAEDDKGAGVHACVHAHVGWVWVWVFASRALPGMHRLHPSTTQTVMVAHAHHPALGRYWQKESQELKVSLGYIVQS